MDVPHTPHRPTCTDGLDCACGRGATEDVRGVDTFLLPAKDSSVFLAREGVRRALEENGQHDAPHDTIVLVVSELATNAIAYGSGDTCHILVSLFLGGTVRVEVTDNDTTRKPTLRCPGTSDEHGRGLVLVKTLTDRWGTCISPLRGKTVWAEFELPGR